MMARSYPRTGHRGWQLPVLLGRLIRNRNSTVAIIAAALGSSVSFFLVTNFMVWATGTLYHGGRKGNLFRGSPSRAALCCPAARNSMKTW